MMTRSTGIVAMVIVMAAAGTMQAQTTAAKPAGQTAKPAGQTASAPKPAAKVALPAAVEAAFKKAYPNATIKNVSKETEAGKVEYEIESMDGAQARDLVYRPDGTVVLYEELIAESDMPAAVVAAIKARYPKATLTRSEKLFQNGTMNYEAALKGAAVAEVILTPAGAWVSPVKK